MGRLRIGYGATYSATVPVLQVGLRARRNSAGGTCQER